MNVLEDIPTLSNIKALRFEHRVNVFDPYDFRIGVSDWPRPHVPRLQITGVSKKFNIEEIQCILNECTSLDEAEITLSRFYPDKVRRMGLFNVGGRKHVEEWAALHRHLAWFDLHKMKYKIKEPHFKNHNHSKWGVLIDPESGSKKIMLMKELAKLVASKSLDPLPSYRPNSCDFTIPDSMSFYYWLAFEDGVCKEPESYEKLPEWLKALCKFGDFLLPYTKFSRLFRFNSDLYRYTFWHEDIPNYPTTDFQNGTINYHVLTGVLKSNKGDGRTYSTKDGKGIKLLNDDLTFREHSVLYSEMRDNLI